MEARSSKLCLSESSAIRLAKTRKTADLQRSKTLDISSRNRKQKTLERLEIMAFKRSWVRFARIWAPESPASIQMRNDIPRFRDHPRAERGRGKVSPDAKGTVVILRTGTSPVFVGFDGLKAGLLGTTL